MPHYDGFLARSAEFDSDKKKMCSFAELKLKYKYAMYHTRDAFVIVSVYVCDCDRHIERFRST